MTAPARGDLVWLDTTPASGHEQAGRRPVLVLSPRPYNQRVGLMLCCPLTRQAKGYPFEVPLPADGLAKGVILADQIRSLDWRARRAELLDRASPQVVTAVLARVNALLQPEDS